ncbi:MAG: hypothetical protein IPK42_06325 [Betaproteobacteria bacterium]|nr:hypothetical protein [Betaproteobacteria bacterium]
MDQPTTPASPKGLGLAVAAAQLALALSWTVYVVFLPALAAQAGLPPRAVLWLLVVDQAVFVLADYACGVASDRVLALHRRLAPWLAGATVLSAAAFLALPWLAPQGSPAVFVAVTLLWTATSSALRAPPLNLIGRHAAKPAQPGLVALAMLGLGLAAAVAPWLALWLKGADPRWPFVCASAGVVLAALALAWAERHAAPRPVAVSTPSQPPAAASRWLLLLAAALLAALALQLHTSLNAAAQFRRFVAADALPLWLPVFWAAFNLALWPAMKLAPKFGELRLVARRRGAGRGRRRGGAGRTLAARAGRRAGAGRRGLGGDAGGRLHGRAGAGPCRPRRALQRRRVVQPGGRFDAAPGAGGQRHGGGAARGRRWAARRAAGAAVEWRCAAAGLGAQVGSWPFRPRSRTVTHARRDCGQGCLRLARFQATSGAQNGPRRRSAMWPRSSAD